MTTAAGRSGPVATTSPARSPRSPGHSVLVVPVPGVEEYVRRRTSFYDSTFLSRDPAFSHAHLTLLGPWLPEPSADDLAVVGQIARSADPFDYTLARVEAFRDGVIHLVADEPAPFEELTRALVDAFPQCPPYAGTFPDPVPHVTLDRIGAGIDVESVRGDLAGSVPVSGRAERIDLQWWANNDCRVLDSWPLGKEVER